VKNIDTINNQSDIFTKSFLLSNFKQNNLTMEFIGLGLVLSGIENFRGVWEHGKKKLIIFFKLIFYVFLDCFDVWKYF
jgi:hypothetical protein